MKFISGLDVRSRMRLVALVLLGAGMMLYVSRSTLQVVAQDQPLFAATSVQGSLTRQDPTVIRTRFVTINFGLVVGTEQEPPSEVLILNLFDDTVLTAHLQRFEQTRFGHTWIGSIEKKELSDVVLVVVNGIMAGSITMPGASYLIEYAGNGVHAIYELNESAFPPEGPVIVPPPPSSPASDPPMVMDNGSVADVMVVYTPAARAGAGGTTAIQAMIDLWVSQTNQAYQNSNINTRLRLVHTAEVVYTESGDMGTDLSRLRNTTDGYMDEVHPMRNTYAADLVALIVETGQYCGIAYLMTSVGSWFESYAFGVDRRACGGLTFAHELGHNQGAHHDWYVTTSPGAYTYSHGHVNVAGQWLTIMSYHNKCTDSGVSCTRITYLSNPNVSYNGAPTGVPPGTNLTCTTSNLNNPDCDADNRLTLNNTAFTVANFRASHYPDAPSNLMTTAVSSSQINLSWQDNSTNETGFKIERKTGIGGSYSQIGLVGANVTTYANTGLSANTQYCYRVRATNSYGDSFYSNESCATTLASGTAARFRIERATGFVFTDGAYYCGLGSGCFNTGVGADIAERIEVSEAVEPGDVVELDPNNPKHYRKARTAYSALVAGVVSSTPGLVMGHGLGEDRRPFLALIGRVPVKATGENGPIRIGDLLTSSSKAGYAMRCESAAQCEGALLGKALESLEDGDGVIFMLVMR